MMIVPRIPSQYRLILSFVICLSWSSLVAAESQQIMWDNLIPENWNPYQVLEEMSDEEYNALSDEDLLKLEKEAQAMFDAAPVIESLNGQRVKIPGFILPLEFENTLLEEFLLVPYFGACIHTPPPPANQIIYGKMETESELGDIYRPVWITGTLKTSRTNNQLSELGVENELEVESAYTMSVETIEPYEE